MNFDGLKDDIISMLAGGRCSVDTTTFGNDPSVIKSKDDVLTVLIHLGYLSYDSESQKCYIPNHEVRKEMENAVKDCSWGSISQVIRESRKLLNDTISGNQDAVARAIDSAHDENTSILSYNDENSLACVLSIAYIWARNEYVIHREMASGKGFADLVLIPRNNVSKPALLIELKCGTAISQIRNKNYPAKLAGHSDNLLLVGINYDRKTKKHTCKIERFRQ